jgi:PAS domain S-box-containing protein
MNLDESNVINENKVNLQSNERLPLIEWSLDITSQKFHYDQKLFNSIFEFKHTINSVADLMAMLTVEKREQAQQIFRMVLTKRQSQTFTCCLMLTDQESAYVEFNLKLAKPKIIEGTMQPLLIFANKMEIANIFQNLFENNHHGIFITNAESKILACNSYFENQMGVNKNELIGSTTDIFNGGNHSEKFYQNMWSKINEKGYWHGVVLSRYPNGKLFPYELTVHKVSPVNEQVFYLALTVDLKEQFPKFNDITLGDVDFLTKQPTKTKFIEELAQFCQQNDKTGKIVLVLKPSFLNESFNQNIIELSDSLFNVNLSRISGYIGEGAFAICTDYDFEDNSEQSVLVRSAIKLILKDLKSHTSKGVYEAIIQGKIGISVLGEDSHSAEELLTNSIEAMVEGHAGEGRHINFYFKSIHEEIARKKQLEIFVANVIDEQLLTVHYQPIINCRTGQLVKFEALCRFPSSGKLKTNIAEVIEIAGELDLIVALDYCISTKALVDLPKIQAKFGQNVGLALNCSLNTKKDLSGVIGKLSKQISSLIKSPHLVTIELTESTYFESRYKKSNILSDLHNIGVNIAIDDFGKGSASFNYLTGGLLDTLKIDKAFISNIDFNNNKYQFVKMITQLSHNLGIKVIAVGVERKEELYLLQALKVDYIQGYLFSEPKALSDLNKPKFYVDRFNKIMRLNVDKNQLDDFDTLLKTNVYKLTPAEQLVKLYEYFQENPTHIIPIVFNEKCLGIVGIEQLNFHLTPTMGTKAETTKESNVWRRPVSQLMNTEFSKLLNTTIVYDLRTFIKENPVFPWVIVDENDGFIGMIFQSDIFKYLLNYDS